MRSRLGVVVVHAMYERVQIARVVICVRTSYRLALGMIERLLTFDMSVTGYRPTLSIKLVSVKQSASLYALPMCDSR